MGEARPARERVPVPDDVARRAERLSGARGRARILEHPEERRPGARHRHVRRSGIDERAAQGREHWRRRDDGRLEVVHELAPPPMEVVRDDDGAQVRAVPVVGVDAAVGVGGSDVDALGHSNDEGVGQGVGHSIGVRERREHVADAGCAHRARVEEEGHVGTEAAGERVHLGLRHVDAPQAGEESDRRRRIGRAAAETGAVRQALREHEGGTGGRAAVGGEGAGGAEDEVVVGGRQVGTLDREREGGGGRGRDRVVPRKGYEDGVEVVVAVRAAPQHVQAEVDFGRRDVCRGDSVRRIVRHGAAAACEGRGRIRATGALGGLQGCKLRQRVLFGASIDTRFAPSSAFRVYARLLPSATPVSATPVGVSSLNADRMRFSLIRGRWASRPRPWWRGALALVAAVSAWPAAAQLPTLPPSQAVVRPRGVAVTELPATTPLEGTIDAQTYRVGPGDVFAVTGGGGAPMQATVPVSADGQIVLPYAGAVPVAGLTLAAARARIVASLRPYVVSGLDAALVQPRAFYVHVAGAVAIPGRTLVPPVARLEDALAQAFAVDSLGRYLSAPPALRSVRIERRSGGAEMYDLLRYRRLGDLAQNPYLGDGDAITVARFDSLDGGATVRVMGDVAFPGVYEWREGDTAAGLVALATGPVSGADTRTVRVNGTAVPVSAATQRVSPGGVLYVERDRDRGTVSVQGAVVAPGAYPIRQGRTTLREIVAAAGGLRDDALVRGAYVVRSGRPDAVRPFDPTTIGAPGDLPYVQRAALGDQFAQSRIAVADVLGGGGDLPLVDGDRLVVPRDEGTVLLVGAVARPGYLPVSPGTTADAYLARAGGLRRDARDVFVVDAATQTFAPAQGRTLGSGDVLLVTTDDPATRPELYGFSLQERNLRVQEATLQAQERERRSNRRFQTASLALSTVSTAVAVVTTYLLIRNAK